MRRYDLEWHRDGGCSMDEWEEGDYVRHEDVAALERRYREAVELLKRYEAEEWRVTCDWSNRTPWERLQDDRDAFLAEEES